MTYVRLVSGFVLIGSVFIVACASDNDETKPSQQEQPLSFGDSCASMITWTRSRELGCQTCISGSRLGCECAKEEPWNGKCEAFARERNAEADCPKELDLCFSRCTDCACKQACLAGHDSCTAKETPLQSCIARTCDTLCR